MAFPRIVSRLLALSCVVRAASQTGGLANGTVDLSAQSLTPMSQVLPRLKIFTFWHDLTHIDIVSKNCLKSWSRTNPHHDLVVLTQHNVHEWVTEWPLADMEGVAVQKLANWIRLFCLKTYGGVWVDASTLATSSLESWVDPDPTKVTLFPAVANEDVYANWAIGSPAPNHPVIDGWMAQLRKAHVMGPHKYIEDAFAARPGLKERWGRVALPYLWSYLALQCALYDEPGSWGSLTVRHNARQGPRHRSALFNTCELGGESLELFADDLATKPLRFEDRFFIKFSGFCSERQAVEKRITEGTFQSGSVIDILMRIEELHFNTDFKLDRLPAEYEHKGLFMNMFGLGLVLLMLLIIRVLCLPKRYGVAQCLSDCFAHPAAFRKSKSKPVLSTDDIGLSGYDTDMA